MHHNHHLTHQQHYIITNNLIVNAIIIQLSYLSS